VARANTLLFAIFLSTILFLLLFFFRLFCDCRGNSLIFLLKPDRYFISRSLILLLIRFSYAAKHILLNLVEVVGQLGNRTFLEASKGSQLRACLLERWELDIGVSP
jgi:uncharacterized membrane protein YbhN (UPF0104 family)